MTPQRSIVRHAPRHNGGAALLAAAAVGVLAAPALAGVTEYLYDDGVSNITFGPPRSFAQYGDVDMLWGNYFSTQQPTELVTGVSFGLGELSAGEQVSVWIFEDADDDFDPTNASPIFSTAVTAHDLGFGFNVLDITPTAVSGGFFVAIGHLAELTYPGGQPDYPSPARFDPDGRADRSWFFYDSDIPEHDLASSGFVQRMDGPYVPIPGAHAVRATTVVPAPGAAALGALALAALAARRGRPASLGRRS